MIIPIAIFFISFTAAADPGPITASIARHAADARLEDDTTNGASWSQLKRLAPATDIVIRTDTVDQLKRVFVSAGDEEITVINSATNPPCGAVSALVAVAGQRPELFDRSRIAVGFIAGDVEVRGDRIVVKGKSDCSTSDVIERLARESIRSVKSPRTTQSNKGWAVAGVTLGFIAGVYTAAATSMNGNCGTYQNVGVGCNILGSAFLWMPVAGGLLGHFATRQVVEKTYYRRDCDCE